MGKLREEQSEFVLKVAELIMFAYAQGFELTLGDAWAKTGHKDNSLHYYRKAIDFNLFKDGEWLEETEDFKILGDYWISIGGTWGGNFKSPDGCHFSWGE